MMKWKIINFIETTKHKAWLAWYILKTCRALLWRATLHDLSKYSPEEAPYLEKVLPRLRNLEYGSDEYKEAIASLGPALKHHYFINSHHPEYWFSGIADMSLLDQMEMLCDWKAATRRHKTGNFGQSLKINEERFKYSFRKTEQFHRDATEIGLL